MSRLHTAAVVARFVRPQASTSYTSFKSVSVSLAHRQEGSRGENVKKSLGNTSREKCICWLSYISVVLSAWVRWVRTNPSILKEEPLNSSISKFGI